MWQDKRVSILGDSISTYRGVSDDGEARESIRYNPWRYQDPFPQEKTYWQRVMDEWGMVLCVNNSRSGGNLSGRDNPDAGVSRADQLARDDGTAPDFVILFMGINDLGRGVDVKVFQEDYQKALQTIAKNHPAAFVCCINLPDRDSRIRARTMAFNAAIQDAAEAMGERFFVADLFSSILKNDFYYDNTTDGLHPNEYGMRYIAEVVIAAMQKVCPSSL